MTYHSRIDKNGAMIYNRIAKLRRNPLCVMVLLTPFI